MTDGQEQRLVTAQELYEDLQTYMFERAERLEDELLGLREQLEGVTRERDDIQRDWTQMYNAKEDQRARADGLLEQLETTEAALRFWVERANRYEDELPPDREYMKALGVLADSYGVGIAAVSNPASRAPAADTPFEMPRMEQPR